MAKLLRGKRVRGFCGILAIHEDFPSIDVLYKMVYEPTGKLRSVNEGFVL